MTKQPTILVVDDEPEMRDVCRAALAREGYLVIEAGDGVEALEILDRHRGGVDLVVSDAVMPRMGGRELIWEMSRRHPAVPVLLASGILHDPDASYGLEVAPAAFVSKPFDLHVLVRTVRDTLPAAVELNGESVG